MAKPEVIDLNTQARVPLSTSGAHAFAASRRATQLWQAQKFRNQLFNGPE